MLGRDIIFHPCGWHIKELAGGVGGCEESCARCMAGAWLP